MSEQVQSMNEINDLGDQLKLVYQEPDEYFNYYSIYYGQKYADYFFRRSSASIKEIVSIFDCGYFIMNNENIIGGVFIKPNFMADLFILPPYEDYEGLVHKLLNYLKKVANTEEKIIVRDVVEEHVTSYEQSGCQVNEVNYWMIRPTQPIKAILPGGYLSKPVLEGNIADIVDLIIESYSANLAYKQIGTKEDYPLIMSLAVHPKHQHKGLGRFLLRHSINISSKEYPATGLSVIEDNPAIKLYEDLGFIKNKSLTEMYVV